MSADAGTRTCSTCGSAMAEGAPFCTACGAAANAAPPVEHRVPVSAAVLSSVAAGGALRVPSPLGRRFGAYVIDAVWSGILSGVLTFGISAALVQSAIAASDYARLQTAVTIAQLVPALLGLGIGLILVACVGAGGTPGMRLLGLEVVRFDDGGKPGFGKALGRQLVLILSGFIIVGPLSPLFDRSGANRGWHDTASGTWVVLKDGVPADAPTPWVPPTAAIPVTPPPSRPVVTAAAPAPGPIAAPAPVVEAFVPPAPAAVVPSAPVVPIASAPVAAPPAPAPAHSPVHRAPDGLVTSVPGAASAPRARPDEDDHTLLRARSGAPRLRFATGEQQLDGSALIGRDPAPRPGEVVDRLITPSDAVRSMSKTHARIDVEPDGVWITDRGSTNGTRLAGPGGWTTLTPNVRTPLADGAEIEFGSVRATVVR